MNLNELPGIILETLWKIATWAHGLHRSSAQMRLGQINVIYRGARLVPPTSETLYLANRFDRAGTKKTHREKRNTIIYKQCNNVPGNYNNVAS